jgi:carbon monoxide dehydrogenase subunit G
MAVLRERIDTALGIEDAFAFVADFANAAKWDPGVATSEQVGAGPIRVGARYRLGVRMGGRIAQMDYTITQLEAPKRVVLTGEGSGVAAVDDIAFEAAGTGTTIRYTADIQLRGLMRLLTPFAGGAFRKLAGNARAGMQRALDERAAARAAAAPAVTNATASVA